MRTRLAIVCSRFNDEITDRMLEAAVKRSETQGAEIIRISRVPGAFDIPLFVAELLKRKDVDAVVTLGAIVTGETRHDEIIAAQLARALHEISLKEGKPVALGVSGPGMNWEQGMERATEYAVRAVDAAIAMHRELLDLRTG
jgi:6,7-dimethyl-8-ribityllumazine synthase